LGVNDLEYYKVPDGWAAPLPVLSTTDLIVFIVYYSYEVTSDFSSA